MFFWSELLVARACSYGDICIIFKLFLPRDKGNNRLTFRSNVNNSIIIVLRLFVVRVVTSARQCEWI